MTRTEGWIWRVVVTGPARSDIQAILRWSRDHFGAAQAERYAAAIEAALRRLVAGPDAPGTRPATPGGAVFRKLPVAARGRHVLVFRPGPDQTVYVLRVLHDAMDIPSHLPPSPEDTA